MDLLKTLFPVSFGGKKEVATLIIKILIYVVGGLVACWILGALGAIPIIGTLFQLLSAVVGIYATAGLAITFLDYFNVLK